MDQLKRMAIFARVVECGSFSEAGRSLLVSKSAVSQQVSLLERELGVRLLNRSTRSLSLTEAGETYYRGCARMLEEAREVNSLIDAHRSEPAGVLRLTCTQEFGSTRLVPVLRDYLARYPRMSVELLFEDQVVNMISERLDLAIRIGKLEDSSLIARKIATVGDVLCASPLYLERTGAIRTPQDLDRGEWIRFSLLEGHNLVQLTAPDGERTRWRLGGRIQSSNTLSIRAMLAEGMGISRLPLYSVLDLLETGELVRLLPEYELPSMGLYALYPRRDYVPRKVGLFLEELLRHFGDHVL